MVFLHAVNKEIFQHILLQRNKYNKSQEKKNIPDKPDLFYQTWKQIIRTEIKDCGQKKRIYNQFVIKRITNNLDPEKNKWIKSKDSPCNQVQNNYKQTPDEYFF